MTVDREKVIKGLECCYASFPKLKGCPVCPYVKICYHDKACDELLRDAIALLKEQDAQDATDIRDIDGLWCDDITFCPELCNWESCPRNQQNIRDRSVPHSFSVGIPEDCPKWKEGR